ncbi:MAG: CoA transferase [Dehalococcoidia bacterium]|nr:CoA transferase [Dehalococcoidia bacterium]
MKKPLEGYRVLDWTIWQQGPVATVMLGDLGAEVIKIEERTGGDPARGMMKLAGASAGVAGRNFYFENNNRNKRSLVVDLRKKEGKEIIYKLVEKSDVFVQNFRQGVAARLGLDYATLSKYNPKLIYVSASGWGPEGPDAEKPAFDYTGLARSGLMSMAGEPDMPPLLIQGGIGDQMGATVTAYAIVTALLARERTGEGQQVDTSLLGSLIWLQGLNVSMQLLLGGNMPRITRAKAGNPLYNHYKCKDGKFLALAQLQPDKVWPSFCKILGLSDLEKDPRFSNMMERGKNCAALIVELDKAFASKDREEWIKLLAQDKEIIVECVATIADVAKDPQSIANKYVTSMEHPVWGPIKVVGPPMKFSKCDIGPQREAPEFGQHTEEILTEMLGYSWDTVSKMKDAQII